MSHRLRRRTSSRDGTSNRVPTTAGAAFALQHATQQHSTSCDSTGVKCAAMRAMRSILGAEAALMSTTIYRLAVDTFLCLPARASPD